MKANPRYLAGNMNINVYISFQAYEKEGQVVKDAYKVLRKVFGESEYIAPVQTYEGSEEKK